MIIYWVYILCNKKYGTLYIGFTGDLKMRIYQHKVKEFEGFTSKYGIDKLLYYEEFDNPEDAIKKEKQMKVWRREWKINLIQKENPHWNDLAEDWYPFEKSRGYLK